MDIPTPERTVLDAHPAMGLVQRLTDANYTPEQIAVFMGGRVSSRTVYRWAAGGSDPQNDAAMEELQRLADKLAPSEPQQVAS